MKVEQIYTGCLAQGAYYIESKGEVAIIDPLREIKPYIEKSTKAGAEIKYIFETHFHADFVSGHVDLSRSTGAPIIYGPLANPSFDAIIAEDGQIFELGDVKIKVIHTPGHTMESTCYLLMDEAGKPTYLFSGDTLFLGDVGRPDLAQKSGQMTEEDLAGMLYDSLMTKIMPLPDDIVVYPAHGAGSACGKNMMKETFDTLGNQKKMNYALLQPDKASFVEEVLDGLAPPPAYFGMNVKMNKDGYEQIDDVLDKGMQKLGPEEFEYLANETNALILDVRNPGDFAKGFIPRSINIGLEGQFAPWVGALIVDVKTPLLLVTYPGKEEETALRLSRVGFDNQLGHISGGFETWKDAGKEVDVVNRIPASQFVEEWTSDGGTIFDVRKESEFENNHVENALNTPLDNINGWLNEARDSGDFFVHCAGGYRSMMAASILKLRGIHNFKEVDGGYSAISKEMQKLV